MDILLKRFVCLLPTNQERLRQLLLATVFLSVLSKLVLSILVMTYHPNGVFGDSDSSEYHRLALNLLQHGTFSQSPQPPYEPEVLRTPAYPLMLAGFYGVFGVQPVIIVFLQIALSVVTIFIGFKIATLLFHEQAGLLTALLLATDPVSIYHTQVLLTETAFTTWVGFAFSCFFHALMNPSRWHWSAGTSICLALATYIRPTGYYLGFIFPLIFFTITFSDHWVATSSQIGFYVSLSLRRSHRRLATTQLSANGVNRVQSDEEPISLCCKSCRDRRDARQSQHRRRPARSCLRTFPIDPPRPPRYVPDTVF